MFNFFKIHGRLKKPYNNVFLFYKYSLKTAQL